MFVGRYGDLPVGLRDRKAECNQSSLPLAISPTIEEYLARGGVITPTRTTEWFCGAGVTRANLAGEAWRRSFPNRSRGRGSSAGRQAAGPRTCSPVFFAPEGLIPGCPLRKPWLRRAPAPRGCRLDNLMGRPRAAVLFVPGPRGVTGCAKKGSACPAEALKFS